MWCQSVPVACQLTMYFAHYLYWNPEIRISRNLTTNFVSLIHVTYSSSGLFSLKKSGNLYATCQRKYRPHLCVSRVSGEGSTHLSSRPNILRCCWCISTAPSTIALGLFQLPALDSTLYR